MQTPCDVKALHLGLIDAISTKDDALIKKQCQALQEQKLTLNFVVDDKYALHYAIETGSASVVELLLREGQ